jgi:phosphoenolpyruvate phosphomutase
MSPRNGRLSLRAGAIAASPGTQLRRILESDELEFLMSVHDGVSARIVEETGFPAAWASGFSIATVLGARDNNEVSWSQLLAAVEVIVDTTSIPIVVDGDTGFGDFNIARRLAGKLCRIGAAGLCLEDKLFPKANSFVDADHQLADVDDFCAKLRACKDATTDDFVVIARLEGFICGRGLEEALWRADAYQAAGADAIFVHSRLPVADEVVAFARRWGDALPLVIAPTTYASAGADVFRDAGISVAIWANHTLRAAVAAMQNLAGMVRRDEGLAGTEPLLAPLDELFRLMDYDELDRAREHYRRLARTDAEPHDSLPIRALKRSR